MAVIISIIMLVAFVSLYDYYTSRTWQQVTSSVRNDLVFQNRNRTYGAFQLRNEYDKRLMFIMLGILLTIGVSYGTYVIIQNLPEEKLPPPPADSTQFTVQAPPVEEDVPPPPPEEPPPPMERTVAFMPPVVVDIPVEDEIPPQEAMEEIRASTETNDTEEENFAPPVQGEEKPPVVEEKPEEIFTFVDEEAEFPGGYPAMMQFIQKNYVYPPTALDMGIEGKVYVKFVVTSDGSITSVQVERGLAGCPECDKEALRVVKLMKGWKPGKVNGKSVSSVFRLPLGLKAQ